MKKTLIALAALAAAGVASAQSSVTLFGIVDAAVSRYVQHGSTYNTVLSNSNYNSSRLGFRGTEDLGGGLSASFWLEGQLTNDDGNAAGFNFQRRSTVSLAGSSWGELRLGRDYTPTFWNISVFDPFGTVGVGSNLVHKIKLQNAASGTNFGAMDPNYVRASNAVAYFLPANLGGFYGQATFAWEEVNGRAEQGRYWGARLGYGSGPFNVAVAYGHTEGTNTAGLGFGPVGTGPATSRPDVNNWNLGGQWDFGMAKLVGTYDHAKYDGGAFGEATLKSWMIGTLVPVGAGEIRASYGRSKLDAPGTPDPTASQFAVGYVHNLSKRTALYGTYARLSNHDGSSVPVNNGVPAALNQSGWGFDLGIRHSF